jgi:transposase
VSHWLECLRKKPTKGRDPPGEGSRGRLSDAQRRLIPDFLSHGAEAYGFRGEVWTCARAAKVIRREFGVSYHKAHVSRILKLLQWTPQKPITRAAQRDEAEITRWRLRVWPDLQAEALHEGRTLVFVDESAFYLLPSVVKTYGPRGHTPVLRVPLTHDHLSVMGAITLEGRINTLIRDRALNAKDTVGFLQHLLHHVGGKLLVIWDGSPIHRGKAVSAFLEHIGRRTLRVERLPPYAPDLNPADGIWSQLKYVELRNLCCHDLDLLYQELCLAIGRLRAKPHLIRSFFDQAGLGPKT